MDVQKELRQAIHPHLMWALARLDFAVLAIRTGTDLAVMWDASEYDPDRWYWEDLIEEDEA